MASGSEFGIAFKSLTGIEPLSWQERLYSDLTAGKFPEIIDLPTGMGKTMVMAIWWVARTLHPDLKMPRRLIYVVDRRTVVDQATEIATALQLGDEKRGLAGVGENELAISTLRGQLADNREWSRNPAKPAIIIGTVDLIGSALLFSGYRSGFRSKPLQAGLLGQDSLLVLDEAHLSKPFDKLITAIASFQSGQGTPMKIILMSATTASVKSDRFKLETRDYSDPVVSERWRAKKTLSITTLGEKDKLEDAVGAAAVGLANLHSGKRIVIFVRTPKLVEGVRKAMIKEDKGSETRIAVLTGTLRGLERDELVSPAINDTQSERSVMQRFIRPENDPSQGSCFLISTSAGEVGFDLNADHMVCDATTIDSFIQRLGRVNRRGRGDATIQLFAEAKRQGKDGKPNEVEASIANTFSLLEGVIDVSPKNIARLKESAAWTKSGEGQSKSPYELACSPEPGMVELTDILLDAWSMTSITAPMPGRPAVGPWLRGIEDEQAQTTFAWRAELDLPAFDQLEPEVFEEWFETHRVLAHETLTVPTSDAAKWFIDRWSSLSEAEQRDLGQRPVRLERAGIVQVTVRAVVDQLNRKSFDAIRNAELILPASFGGIERGKGLLDPDYPAALKEEADEPVDHRKLVIQRRAVAADAADERGRYREVVVRSEDEGDVVRPLIPGTSKPPKMSTYTLVLESEDDKTVKLVSYVPRADRPDSGQKSQSLEGHVADVRSRADAIIKALGIAKGTAVCEAVELAADFHDHGKNRDHFQRTVGGQASSVGRPWPSEVRGKSGGVDRGTPRGGYRHEFGSLREFVDAHGGKVSNEVFDLAMHLIAAHHGRGRPHFPKGAFDPDAEARSEGIHTDAIRRFARLQRKYGHWHLAWLENLLRCSDALASAEPKTDIDDATGGPR